MFYKECWYILRLLIKLHYVSTVLMSGEFINIIKTNTFSCMTSIATLPTPLLRFHLYHKWCSRIYFFECYSFSTPSFYKPFYSLYGDDKESACNSGDPDSVPGLRRSPGEGNGKLLQYSCLENPMNGGTLQATVPGIAKTHSLYEAIYF